MASTMTNGFPTFFIRRRPLLPPLTILAVEHDEVPDYA